MILTGQAGAKQIVELGGITNVYSSLRKVEELTVQGLVDYFQYLDVNDHYKEPTDIRGVWSIDKAQAHEITVECFGQTTVTEGFNQNEQIVEWTDGTNSTEYRIIGGRFEFTIEVKCRSTQRSSVIYLADAVITGLNTNVNEWLKQNAVYIPAMAVRVSQKPVKVQITKDTQSWELSITVDKVGVEWRQIVELSGDILRNFGYFLNLIQS